MVLSEIQPDPYLCSPKLYFVKLDVQACFDTIEQTKLLSILRELISKVCSVLATASGDANKIWHRTPTLFSDMEKLE